VRRQEETRIIRLAGGNETLGVDMALAKVRELHVRRDVAQYEQRYTWNRESRGEAVRPFRLWDAVHRRNIQWRYYSDPKRAHLGALIECRWSPIGHSIEVYDCRTGRLLGQYTRRLHAVQFTEG